MWLIAFGRAVFGDRRGLLAFLVAVAAAMLVWRTTVSINDNYTVINGLVAVSQGRVFVMEPTFGETLATPGMVRYEGRAIPRNYAHIVLALPALWGLQAIEAVASLRLALTGAWWLTVLAAVSVAGSLVSRKRLGQTVGSLVALVGFTASVSVATPLDPPHLAALALQATTVVIAGLCAVLVYRTVALLHDDRTALVAGLAVALASPGLLWASIPKRHVLTAGLALTSLFLLAASRARAEASDSGDEIGTRETTTRWVRLARQRYPWRRALAYVPIGLTVWLHAAEGFVLLAAVAGVDLLTARDRSLRSIGTIAVVFACSLVPFVVTNLLISGDPFTVPRMLPPYDAAYEGVRFVGEAGGEGGGTDAGGGGGADKSGTDTGGSGTDTGGAAETDGSSTDAGSGGVSDGGETESGGGNGDSAMGSVVSALNGAYGSGSSLVSSLTRRLLVVVGMIEAGVTAATAEPSKAYHMFLRSGYVGTDGRGATGLAINLAFLESLPLAGALVAAPVVALERYRAENTFSLQTVCSYLATPRGTADAFVLVYASLLALLYLPRLPIHAMLTARYIYPLFPLGIYAVARLPAVRAAVTEAGWPLAFSYGGGVLIGGQLTALTIALVGLGVDEAMQGYALLALALAAALGGWSLVTAWTGPRHRSGAVLLGLAGAVTTNLVGLIAYQYFGRAFLLPIVPS